MKPYEGVKIRFLGVHIRALKFINAISVNGYITLSIKDILFVMYSSQMGTLFVYYSYIYDRKQS